MPENSPRARSLPSRLDASLADQLGYVVPSLEASVGAHAADHGISTWRVATFDFRGVPNVSYQGKPANHSLRVAIGGTHGDPQVELVQPMRGPSAYEGWSQGPRQLQHCGFTVTDLDEQVDRWTEAGYELLMQGRGYGKHGDGGFAYFDTVVELGWLLELIEPPAVMPPPDEYWYVAVDDGTIHRYGP